MKTQLIRQLDRTHRARKTSICIGVVALCSILASPLTTVHANERHVVTERFTEFAKVINVQPIYRDVQLREPREECWTEQQTVTRYEYGHKQSQRGREHHSSGNAIVGGLIGGVIGNQLGRGHSSGSRAGATVAGAIIGGAIANETRADASRHRRHRPAQAVQETRPVERCKRVVESRYEQRLQHYNVTYRYKGRTFTTQMPRDPGNKIELQVSVRPARR